MHGGTTAGETVGNHTGLQKAHCAVILRCLKSLAAQWAKAQQGCIVIACKSRSQCRHQAEEFIEFIDSYRAVHMHSSPLDVNKTRSSSMQSQKYADAAHCSVYNVQWHSSVFGDDIQRASHGLQV